MNPDIERLAKEAGMWDWGIGSELLWTCPADRLSKFAALIAEDCAKEAEDTQEGESYDDEWGREAFYGRNSASAIRQKFPMPGEQG